MPLVKSPAECNECCDCPPAASWGAAKSVSKTKCGTAEYTDISSPPKFFRKETQSGTAYRRTFSNTCPSASAPCPKCYTIIAEITLAGGYDCSTGVDDPRVTWITTTTSVDCDPPRGQSAGCSAGGSQDQSYNGYYAQNLGSPISCSGVITRLQKTFDCEINDTFNTCDGATFAHFSQHTAITLSDEYTDTELEQAVDDAMMALAYPANAVFSPVACLNWSTDRKTLEKESSIYRPRFNRPKVGRGTCYKIKSATRFTPPGSDAVTYTDLAEEIWDGTVDPTDSTKGLGAERTLDVPATEGETVVGWYADPTDHSTFVRDFYGVVCSSCA